ncbi:glycosyltransferase family 2 protein [Elizabethkingia anophelis]|uniref:glycosyltransferase family 2 protein n=1 Tax=Elizabethkingia anophelis TaxID=1117645 RepID=UPI00099B1FAE|nr:glycosyltransferase family 2 protein [Elizabethkingia anophelis]MCT3720734.1 glycosyltransferase family 2 protein [Elizabethkingia anophelis]MCT3724120.1 glycosyltransferase family 2 protein [Elizabethkingia anophelis]MCT3756464.1 glycosyltransferase family 2 protein [Elizabethkingia anophelis]MCT3777293.1 glycosyltransferase family 2 protein [Elizabethkingia anophelis]MCT3784406.1 glycosyltransferase family 2 protein [Elizabethkingia anophelis]
MMVSFILPAYKARFLSQAIDSILKQSYSDLELVIIDDASPENILDVVSSFDDSRISYYRNEKNLGGDSLVKQWNHSIKYAKGEYLILAADDDLYHPDFLKNCVALANKYPQVDLIRSGAEQIDENNVLIGIDGILPEYCSKYQYVYYWLNSTAFTCIGNYMFKASVLEKKQFIDFPFAFGSDTASTIDMAENGIANTEGMLFKFRISSIHLSSNKGRLKEKLEAITLLFTWLKNLNYNVPSNAIDKFCYDRIQWDSLYPKCKYDYYNLVIKYLPFSELSAIKKCELISKKDRFIMIFRYIKDKVMR